MSPLATGCGAARRGPLDLGRDAFGVCFAPQRYVHGPSGAAPLAALEADIRRTVAIWHDARTRFGKGGPFLFGTFTNADAMFAPVATRFRTYGVDVSRFGDDGTAQAYAEAILAMPELAEWAEGAIAETRNWKPEAGRQ
jgi:glutathione S-transferase